MNSARRFGMSQHPSELLIDLAVDGAAMAQQLHADLAAAVMTANRLDELEAQAAMLEGRPLGVRTGGTPATDISAARRAAIERLEGRGLHEQAAELADLIEEVDAAQLQRQYSEFKPIRCRLDRTDLLVAGVAGLVAGAVDMLVVRIPRTLRWHDSHQRGSWLTSTLRDLSIPSDNWLAGIARVPFDEIVGHGNDIPGLGPRTHRVHTFGHDPLFGLLLGTLDIMRGTISGAGRGGVVGVAPTASAGIGNPLSALALEVMHLLSDLPTRCGLPLPGWTMAMSSNVNVGGRPVHELTREMYLRGYDSWHLLTMATSPAAIELVLRSYWGLRMSHDEHYRLDNEEMAALGGTEAVGDHPRFRAMALAANGIGAAMNVAKILAFGGNPLAANYAQWVAFTRSLLRYTSAELLKPGATTDALIRQYSLNTRRLEALWTEAEPAPPGDPAT